MRIAFHSFEGRYSDNPRALYEALVRDGAAAEHEVVWLADPRHGTGFPEDVATVPWGTPEGRAALEAADLLVANTHTDCVWDKRPEAVYLQTWHGTPLKRIHWDVLWAPEGRLERLQGDVDRWDLLVSPSPAATPLLRGAFHFEGEVLETGYPRNDVLVGREAGAVRARVRRELGLADGTTAVLYTPTWRDDAVFEAGGRAPSLELDVDRFRAGLGADVVLLLRLHYMLTGALGDLSGDRVLDVSLHPEVAELYLAADVLVTDYSSTMFDFGVTGKPQAFFVYDLEDYADRLRGFYFELEPIAPGPLVRTTGELVRALGDLDGLHARYAERRRAFHERFCGLEDGGATRRVLDRALALARERGAR
ncbi:CDP-glycerol glycerophosphotransferase family protein [Conexibacter sp. SYSU D00693]|uniref:CDP-glycerol glycerophosphotransferase family protein n=1 Tax=Conexibacter sp. SYSU D00693 TaxID=2812560 RepID=UPI00196B1921|nr:CDP-glycerol glycerophosphotransferase family protein [Conexibacter sp. SYSU D00693]